MLLLLGNSGHWTTCHDVDYFKLPFIAGFTITFADENQQRALAEKIPFRMQKINLLQELELQPEISYCDESEHWNKFKLKDWLVQDFPWRPPFLPEEHKYALMDATGGSFRPRKGMYYIPALQTRICEANEEEFHEHL